MGWDITLDSTDQESELRFVDSTTGAPETGVVAATAGLDLWYRRNGGAKTAISPVDLAAVNSAHSDGGIKHVSDGYYRIDLPDAACAAGAVKLTVGGGATGMVCIGNSHRLEQDVARIWAAADRTVTNLTVNAVATRQTGTLTIYAGESYLNADSTNLSFTKSTGATWPTDLTGWTITFTADVNTDNVDVTGSNPATITATGAVVTATGSSQAVRVDLTAAATAALSTGSAAYDYEVKAVSGSAVRVLESGTMSVLAMR